MDRIYIGGALVALLALLSPVFADLSGGDAAFLKAAAEASHLEVAASRLATVQARRPEVQAYAERALADHARAGVTLARLAGTKSVELPVEPRLTQRARLERLAVLRDADFDRRYLNAMAVEAHEDALRRFRKAAEATKDPDIRAYAEGRVPVLERHLAQARALQPRAAH